jgi:hypothetical protein
LKNPDCKSTEKHKSPDSRKRLLPDSHYTEDAYGKARFLDSIQLDKSHLKKFDSPKLIEIIERLLAEREQNNNIRKGAERTTEQILKRMDTLKNLFTTPKNPTIKTATKISQLNSSPKFIWTQSRTKLSNLFSLLIKKGFLSQALISHLADLLSKHFDLSSETSNAIQFRNCETKPFVWHKSQTLLLYSVNQLFNRGMLLDTHSGNKYELIKSHFIDNRGNHYKIKNLKQAELNYSVNNAKSEYKPRNAEIVDDIISQLIEA